jgi:hypothetical protein
MSQNFLSKATFHLFLFKIDQEIAINVLLKGCPYCGGQLHVADYPRSPFGIPAEFRGTYDTRLSFCCGACRKRTTPSSVRFFGRRWFVAPVLLLISALRLGVSERRRAQVKRLFGVIVSESTWRRWRRWWRESFTITPFWQQATGLVAPLPDNAVFPRVLLRQIKGNIEERMPLLLRFLSPLTAGILRAV